MNLYEEVFVANGGDPNWLNGLEHIPVKLRAIADINKILAHRPWLLNKTHIEVTHAHLLEITLNIKPSLSLFFVGSLQRLTKGQNSWSLSEVVHAIVLLAHFHSLSSFVFSCGLTQELDAVTTSHKVIENNNVLSQKTAFDHLNDLYNAQQQPPQPVQQPELLLLPQLADDGGMFEWPAGSPPSDTNNFAFALRKKHR